jgi:hypothetical protein
VLPAKGRHELGVLYGLGIEKVALDLGGAPERVGEPVADAQAVVALLYF